MGIRARGLLLLAGIAVALSATSAWAYIPPGSFILRKMGGKLAPLRGITATVAGQLFEGGADAAARNVSGKLYLAAPDRFRLEAGDLLEVWMGGSRTVRGPGVSKTEAVSRGHVLPALFLQGNPQAALQERGVNTRLVTLGRYLHYLCWVVGSKAEDPERPQLWVDKDTFLPVRFVYFEGEGENRRRVEWSLQQYDPVDSARPFPRILELARDGKRELRLSVQALSTREVPRESTFSIRTGSP
jgi:outer membrane lipoprotein-sorting protein